MDLFKRKKTEVPSPLMQEKIQNQDLEQFKMKELIDKELRNFKSQKCPFIGTCNIKVLPRDFEILCQDKNKGIEELKLIHLKGRHLFELCKKYYENIIERDGKLPREYLNP